jgi:hypothetical protein
MEKESMSEQPEILTVAEVIEHYNDEPREVQRGPMGQFIGPKPSLDEVIESRPVPVAAQCWPDGTSRDWRVRNKQLEGQRSGQLEETLDSIRADRAAREGRRERRGY